MPRYEISLYGFFCFLALAVLPHGSWAQKGKKEAIEVTTYKDVPFWQEYHEAYPVSNNSEDNQVRSITVDKQSNVWIATPTGVYMKKADVTSWTSPLSEADQGPAFSIANEEDGTVWMSTWNGVYRYKEGSLIKIEGVKAPISVLCSSQEGMYALGPHGIWLYRNSSFEALDYPLARSVRNAVSDGRGGIWVATDVGLYHAGTAGVKHFQRKEVLLSAYTKGIALDKNQKLWVGGLGGVTILDKDKKERVLDPKDGIPSLYVNSVERSPDGTMWVGTNVGVVRYHPDGSRSLRFSRRWLLDDQVNDMAFDGEGNAWIATNRGVSAIKKKQMTLVQKQEYFYDVLMKRHIRAPWIAGQCHLTVPGDVTSWQPEDDDNDGEYTSMYLATECFRYAVTKDPDAREKARKAFEFLRKLQEVTGTEGFFARTIVPAIWEATRLHDGNRTYTDKQRADELVREPRYKPVETRWRKSKDGQWLWKGDTSSDEMCGHMMGYYFYYELVADEVEKQVVRQHVRKIVDYLIAHDFNFIDTDGLPTRWAVWSPAKLNRDSEWAPDRNQNSMELLAFMKFAYSITGDEKYQKIYRKLIEEEGYLHNMANIPNQNPAWFIYFDVMLSAYCYPLLLKGEKDPKLLAFYQKHVDEWLERRKGDKNPLINFLYSYSMDKKVELAPSLEFLIDTPLDLVDWTIDHTKREDVKVVHAPVLDELQVDQLPPASIRTTVRWDKNPWAAINGYPDKEREPVFWLLPYWMGRYLGMIQ
ncbi:ligand-binding sensor domain-containing protein [Telluribacter humicola]|uniref:ligand-binding sensor domain-containing protein n=1 Tax=Telluribacter humicola TaxID=1720261 RepID=UPI001A96CEFF|nr:two-component regulator propeller domain-containing protein [Telluribacter humicola]